MQGRDTQSLCSHVKETIKYTYDGCLAAKSSLTLCHPMDCSTPGSPVLHYHPEFAQIHVHRVDDAIQPSHPLLPSSFPFNLCPASESFPMNQLFTSGGQSTGVSASTSVLPDVGKYESKRRRRWQRMRWLDSITNSRDMNLSKLPPEDGEGQGSLESGSPWGRKESDIS